MEYIIKNGFSLGSDTVFTEVEYNIEGNIITVDVAHFNPQNDMDIILGIENRYITEMYKIFPDRMPPIPVFIPMEYEENNDESNI